MRGKRLTRGLMEDEKRMAFLDWTGPFMGRGWDTGRAVGAEKRETKELPRSSKMRGEGGGPKGGMTKGEARRGLKQEGKKATMCSNRGGRE